MEQSVDLLTALAGGSFNVDHLDERTVKVVILPGEIIRPGTHACTGLGLSSHHLCRFAQSCQEPWHAIVSSSRAGRSLHRP